MARWTWLRVATVVVTVALSLSDAHAHKKGRSAKTPAPTDTTLSDRDQRLQNYQVFGFAPDPTKEKRVVKALAKAKPTTTAKSKKKSKKKKTKSKDEADEAPDGTYNCGQDGGAVLTTCTMGKTQELCILSTDQDGKCTAQFIQARNDGGTTGQKLVAIEDFKEPLSIQIIPDKFDVVSLNDLDRGIVLVNQVVPNGTTTFQITKSRVKGYPTRDFEKLTLPATLQTLDLSANSMEVFNPNEWVNQTTNLTRLVLKNNQLQDLANVVFPTTLTSLILADNIFKGFKNVAAFPAALETLELGHNYLTNLSTLPLQQSKGLLVLNLAENKFATLQAADVKTLPPSLRTLIFANNNISSVEPNLTWPANLESLDLSNNNLRSIAALTTLPPKLKKLLLNDNPVQSFVIPLALFDKLNAIETVTFATMPAAFLCPTDAPKATTTHKTNTIQVCVQGLKDGAASSTLPIVLGAVGGAVCLAAFAVYAYRRHTDGRRHEKPCNAVLMDERHLDELDYDDRRAVARGGIVMGRRHDGSHGSTDESVGSSVVGGSCADYPRALAQHAMLRSFAIPCDAIVDLSPYVGDTSRGQLQSGRHVLLKPLLTDHDMDILELHAALPHPKIVTFVGVTWDISGTLSLVTEYMPRGNLRGFLENAAAPVPLPTKLMLAIDVAEALTFLHFLREPLVHLHVTYAMVFLEHDGLHDEWSAKLRLPLDGGIAFADAPWTAPEVVRGDRATPAADIYSFGVLLAFLDQDFLPHPIIVEEDGDVTTGDNMQLLPTFTSHGHMLPLGLRCIADDPAARPSAMDVVYALKNILHQVRAIVVDE
ncbi:Aste57867_23049 [Aphanomyces stellatus]|uniref:non-specific serine/threonine protein kinase n=1 Tax=Aphanomyces stellatus TaxID=120398 RepID=A0A485LMR6_9STRA|nr:hypothetical protein As57867_022978 [Aphanomyces stellatus]VFT99697.1 Aste57867_23049 [Aphanomyces stellatus]